MLVFRCTYRKLNEHSTITTAITTTAPIHATWTTITARPASGETVFKYGHADDDESYGFSIAQYIVDRRRRPTTWSITPHKQQQQQKSSTFYKRKNFSSSLSFSLSLYICTRNAKAHKNLSTEDQIEIEEKLNWKLKKKNKLKKKIRKSKSMIMKTKSLHIYFSTLWKRILLVFSVNECHFFSFPFPFSF